MHKSLLLILLSAVPSFAADVPQTVEETWANFDPRAEPLETEVIREWTEDGIVLRHVRYLVGSFNGKKPRVAAFHAFPKEGKNLPGIVQLHGGGQRAAAEHVRYWASQGYAAMDVNWGEHVIDRPDDPVTDWAGIAAGFRDPKHHNDVTPGENTLHSVPHPWNSSWVLYSAAARRAITLLEKQSNVDADRIGVLGHSMGGRLTVLTANDSRVRAASPSVGGSGYLYDDIRGVPRSARRMRADLDLYNRTLDCRNYWPQIKCPLLFLGATNDFNSPMELVIKGFRSLPQRNGGLAFTPHKNHRFTTNTFAARVLWFETHLKDNFDFPKMAKVKLNLKTGDGIPRLTVRPDMSVPYEVQSVVVYFGHDREPRIRFWRTADIERNGDTWSAACPVMEIDEPLFTFANVTYDTGKVLTMPRGYRDTSLLTITSECRQAAPHQLAEAGVRTTVERQRLIDDFQHGWQDWFQYGAEHSTHWEFGTHKVADSAFFGPRNAQLAFTIVTTKPTNRLAVIIETDKWRSYTGRKPKRFVARVDLPTAGSHDISLPVSAFVGAPGEKLQHYDYATTLIFTPGNKALPRQILTPWQGTIPTFDNLRWVDGEFAARTKTYLGKGIDPATANADFRSQFDKDVEESVKREQNNR